MQGKPVKNVNNGYRPGDLLIKTGKVLADAAKPVERADGDTGYHLGDWFLKPAMQYIGSKTASAATFAGQQIGQAYDGTANAASRTGIRVVGAVAHAAGMDTQGVDEALEETIADQNQNPTEHQLGDVAKGFVKGIYTGVHAAATLQNADIVAEAASDAYNTLTRHL